MTAEQCRCGYNGTGEHLCHRCGKVPGSLRFRTYLTCLAGVQTKFGARDTWGCDNCWEEYNKQIKELSNRA
jgi:hypothetical protein